MSKNDSKTMAFEAVNKKGFKSKKSRQKLVIAIFTVVILILLAFATLIIGKIIDKLGTDAPPVTSGEDFVYIPKDAGDVKMGNLLMINDSFKYEFSGDFSNMINLYSYQKNESNKDKTHINGYATYSFTYSNIVLEENTLDAFNKMMLDYCSTLDLSSASKNSASNIIVAWGGYSQETVDEYQDDVTNIGKDYYDHALGTTMTLKIYEPSTVITESILKQNYTWIYENAHKYGFVIRFPDACKDHTSLDSSKRVHIRYIGVAHATYMYENGLCFEKYLETLRNKYSSTNPLTFSAGGKEYSVYYVKYSGNPTSVPVPKNSNYTISGDNMNGFIVAVEK